MKALLLIAHGSRRDASNQEVVELAEKLTVLAGTNFDLVKACFLELAAPGIGIAISECADMGIKDITAVPYFLSAGRHVAEDVPEDLTIAARQHKEISISVCPHIGAISMMPDLVLGAALTSPQSRIDNLVQPSDTSG
mgnify:CR=1 FL=1